MTSTFSSPARGDPEGAERALAVERKQLEQANAVLLGKALALGMHPVAASSAGVQGQSSAPPRTPERASLFVVPGDTAGSDALRARAAALARQLVALQNERARNVDEAKFLGKVNGLLVRRRDVLRLEVARLERTRATVEARNATLTRNEAAAEVEHRRLLRPARGSGGTQREARKAVTAQRRADAALQEHTQLAGGEHRHGAGQPLRA
jgi:hypothetical protein